MESAKDPYLFKKRSSLARADYFFNCRKKAILREIFRFFPPPSSSPSPHRFLLKAGSKIDFKSVAPDLIFPKIAIITCILVWGVLIWLGVEVGREACRSSAPIFKAMSRVNKPLTENLIRPEDRVGNFTPLAQNQLTVLT